MSEELSERIQLLLDDPYEYARTLDVEGCLAIIDTLGVLAPAEKPAISPARRRQQLRNLGWL